MSIHDYANMLLSHIPDNESNRSVRGRIKTVVQLYDCNHFTELEAVLTISGIMANRY